MILNFENLLIKEVNNSEVIKLKKDVFDMIKYLQSIQKYFNGNLMQMREFVFEELDKQLKEYLKILSTDLIQKEVSVLDTLNNNQHLLKSYYEKLKDVDLEGVDLNRDKNELNGNEVDCQSFEVKVLIQSIRREKDEINPMIMNSVRKIYECKDSKEKEKYKEEFEKDPELKQMYEYVEIFLPDLEEESLKMYTKYRLEKAKTMLKDNEKRRLKIAGKFFKRYNLLEKMRNKVNNDYQKVGLEEMQYSLRTDGIQEDVGVENIFEDEYIDTLTEEQLSVLNAYWQNRYTKEAEDIKNSLFVIESLQLWEHILDDNVLESITSDDLENSWRKIQICNKVFKKIKDTSTIQEKKQGNNSIKREKDNILIGIDYPGFNSPIMLHTDRKLLLEYFDKTKEHTIIPIYEGEKDGEYEGKLRARAILMPLTEKRESYIIKMNKQAKTVDKNYIFIRHLGNLVTKKVKSISKIYPTEYVDLKTGNTGHKVNGEFIVENIEEIEDEKNIK